jgi:hypothetical protein
LDIVVNNAGILRDRMLFSMTEEEFDAVIAVHLKGTFAMTRHACAYWRAEAKRGEGRGGRIINTTSGTGLFGTAGQANYGAAKAGIISLTTIAAIAPGEIRDTAGQPGRGRGAGDQSVLSSADVAHRVGGVGLDQEFHHLIAVGSRNERLASSIEQLRDQTSVLVRVNSLRPGGMDDGGTARARAGCPVDRPPGRGPGRGQDQGAHPRRARVHVGRGLELHAEASRVTAASPLAVRWCEEKINDKTNYRNGQG